MATDFGARLERDYNPLVERIYAFPKVTIAALNGPTVGASANIALACDILLAARPICRRRSPGSRWCPTRAAPGRCRERGRDRRGHGISREARPAL